jgi:hypothetical protein
MPLPVRDGLLCYQWGTLPHSGGLVDQPVKRLATMTAAMNVYDAFFAYTNKQVSGSEFSKRYPHYWRIIVEVERGTS